jgi:glycosyltransferase involved in cell wall biosynthesis
VNRLALTYSVADQNFEQTNSIGIFNLSVQLAETLAQRSEFEQFTVLSNHTLAGWLRLPPHVSVIKHDQAVAGRLQRIFWDQWGVYRAARQVGHAWLFLPKGFASFVSSCPVRLVTCVADANHDYYRRHYPGTVTPFRAWYFRQSLRGTIKHSRIIFTISEFTASEVRRVAQEEGLTPPVIRPMGIGFRRPMNAWRPKQNRLVVLVSPWPHKRADLAVDFLTRWQKQTPFSGTVELVGRLPACVRLPDIPGWKHHPRLPETAYRDLIAEARVLLYCSDYEGFGMPPVEAVLAGCCPVYSELPATREVMAGVGLAFLNTDFLSFARALDTALKVSDDQLRAWAEVLLQRHDWDRVADRVIHEIQAWDRAHSTASEPRSE